jgi:VIT1/CCC1 family predicted Fe2+/Mn2+ transporter
MEERHIDAIPEGEREEIRQIFAQKGFAGPVLEEIVAVITRDRRLWVDTMLTEELGLQLDGPVPWKAALVTFAGFFLAGMIPLLPFLLPIPWTAPALSWGSAVATGVAFFGIGVFKGRVLSRPMLATGLETLLIGGGAASLAYVVGVWLRHVAGTP